MISAHLEGWDLAALDLIVLENVGNLVCPTAYDLGEDTRVALLSVTEGEDKPVKYPQLFHSADVVVITKTDIAAAVEWDRDAAMAAIRAVNPTAPILETSSRTGDGVLALLDLLLVRVDVESHITTAGGTVTSVLWFQGGACSGNTMSFINAAEPSVVDLIVDYGLEIIYHPTLSMEIGKTAQDLFWSYARGEKEIDIFVYEGTVIEGPNGTGRFDMFAERPMKDWVDDIAPKAGLVVAIGDCATWGGLPAVPPNPSDSRGLQFDRGGVRGGHLGPDFVSKLGLPVINIPGCPAHPDWISQILVALATGRVGDLALDDLQRPTTFFTSFTQTGCTRVQFYNYKQDPPSFGQGMRTGCLFYEFGCRGPMTHSPCNRILWNRQSSKTRAGHPCTGCTEPGFPHGDLEKDTVFKTQKVAGVIPKDEPAGMDAGSYMALAGLSRAVAPKWSKEDMFVV